MAPGKAYPDDLQAKLEQSGYDYKVVNEGTSGATTKDAVVSLPEVLRLHPDVAIVEFGGNDGLRGLPLTDTEKNLDTVIAALEAAHVKVLLAGITLPPNYGPDYIHAFDGMFSQAGGGASHGVGADDLQGPGARAGNDPGGWDSSDSEGRGDGGGYDLAGAEAFAETIAVSRSAISPRALLWCRLAAVQS